MDTKDTILDLLFLGGVLTITEALIDAAKSPSPSSSSLAKIRVEFPPVYRRVYYSTTSTRRHCGNCAMRSRKDYTCSIKDGYHYTGDTPCWAHMIAFD